MKCIKCNSDLQDEDKFCTSCGASVSSVSKNVERLSELNKTEFKNEHKTATWKKVLWVIIGLFIVIGIFSDSSEETSTQINNQEVSQIPEKTIYTQTEVAENVVNIICLNGDESSGGSGTILNSEGVILTNSHIIPQDVNEEALVDECVITLPDPKTGKPEEIYIGTPVIIPILSSKYDLAFVSIDKPYIDEDGVSYGQDSRVFSGQLDNGCENDEPVLGEKVKVFGYPAISGDGLYLTITEGIVSSLPDDGTIVTSAKVSFGNSGGLAVDKNGCMIGVPSMISSDEGDSFGVIVSNNIIIEFFNKLQALMELTEE